MAKSKKRKSPTKRTTKRKKGDGTSLYWKIYRVVAQEVKQQNLGWDYKKRKQVVSDKIYPIFKGRKSNQVKVEEIKNVVNALVGKISRYYNPLLIPTPFVSGIFWFDIDDFITTSLLAEVDPLNLRFELNGGNFGSTGIIDISNYDFYTNGIDEIYQNIREEIGNSSDAEWSAIPIVRDGYLDDGKADSYYLRFTLFINGQEVPVSDKEVGKAEVEWGKVEERKKKRKDVVARKKELAKKRREEKKQGKIKKALLPTKKVKEEDAEVKKQRAENIQNALKDQREALADTERLYKEGILTKKEFIEERKALIKMYTEAVKRFEKGGEL